MTPDDQSRNDQKNGQGRLLKKNGIVAFQVDIEVDPFVEKTLVDQLVDQIIFYGNPLISV